ncbi:MAG TPA: DUF2652 domain-containing protein [Saprospiraceae bacterium]|nr:DUF2652 domain-containing protein [Saprospiraceae bacterium]
MESSDIKRIFIILVDISGYTRFVKYHKTSLLHAEKIVALLMESILEQVEVPVIAHEILGDAISLYAVDEGIPGQADKIYAQLDKYFPAFREREANLISECKLCPCDSCQQVGKLKLKAILHVGEAAFTRVLNTRKISGEDVIISHRLLKNSVPSKEYILMTKAFADRCHALDTSGLTRHTEQCEGIGEVDVLVRNFEDGDVSPAKLSFRQKLTGFMVIEGHMVKRLFAPSKMKFRNLPE